MKYRRFRQKPYRPQSLDATRIGPWLRLLAALLLAAALVLGVILALPALQRLRASGLRQPSGEPTPQAVLAPVPTTAPHPILSNEPQRISLPETYGLPYLADPSAAEGRLLFTAGSDGTRYERLFLLSPETGTAEPVEGAPEHDTFCTPVANDRYLAVFDAQLTGGGTLRVLDLKSGQWTRAAEVAAGFVKPQLDGNWLIWAEQAEDSKSRLFVYDLASQRRSTLAVWEGAPPSLCVTDGRVVFAEAEAA